MGEAEELKKREKESGGAPKRLGSRMQEKEVASGRERWAIPRAWSILGTDLEMPVSVRP